ncbi:MAG TPA: SDR family NAD(P)-dependent oxidoreductase, partial [Solirubrobacterales bacterium]
MSKVIVVTERSAGVGRTTARAFGGRSDRVALVARASDSLTAAADEVIEAGGEALAVPADVADCSFQANGASHSRTDGDWRRGVDRSRLAQAEPADREGQGDRAA